MTNNKFNLISILSLFSIIFLAGVALAYPVDFELSSPDGVFTSYLYHCTSSVCDNTDAYLGSTTGSINSLSIPNTYSGTNYFAIYASLDGMVPQTYKLTTDDNTGQGPWQYVIDFSTFDNCYSNINDLVLSETLVDVGEQITIDVEVQSVFTFNEYVKNLPLLVQNDYTNLIDVSLYVNDTLVETRQVSILWNDTLDMQFNYTPSTIGTKLIEIRTRADSDAECTGQTTPLVRTALVNVENSTTGHACDSLQSASLGSQTGTTSGNDTAQSSCGATGAPEDAWSFTPSVTDTYCMDTFGSDFDTVLYVRDNCTDDSAELVCNDDTNGLQSQIEVSLTAGETYYVFVDGFSSGSYGDYNLNITQGACVVPTYECNDGIDNDGDGYIDYPADAGCVGDTDDNESEGVIDLYFDNLYTNPLTIYDTDSFDLFAELFNVGAETIINEGDFYIDGVFEDRDGGSVPPGSIPTQWSSGALSAGQHTLTLVIDPDNRVNETNESNNNVSFIITVFANGTSIECQDGIDNDGDGLTDLDDYGCMDANDNNESNIDYLALLENTLETTGLGQSIGQGSELCYALNIYGRFNLWISADNVGGNLWDADYGCDSTIVNEDYVFSYLSPELFVSDMGDFTCSNIIDNRAGNTYYLLESQYVESDGDFVLEESMCPVYNDMWDLCFNPVEQVLYGIPSCDNATTECSDGIDNDGDGYTDYPADSGCDNIFDNDESDSNFFISEVDLEVDSDNYNDISPGFVVNLTGNDADFELDVTVENAFTSIDIDDVFVRVSLVGGVADIDNIGDINAGDDEVAFLDFEFDDSNPTGIYEVTIIASGTATSLGVDYVDSFEFFIDFTDNQPVVSVNATPTEGVVPLTVNFSCSATGGDGVLNYIWDFNDFSFAFTPIISHTYSNPGVYYAACVVEDSDGDYDSETIIINVTAVAQCQDGLDNDGDGLTDMFDPGCSAPTDDDESDGTSECQDGIDNDGDNATDYPADIGCSSPQDDDEGDVLAECQDGIDNDGDGNTDYPADTGCYSSQDDSELNGYQCDNGADDDGDGLVDMNDPGCDNTTDNDESDGTSQCQDGLDNDGDGLTDMNDPGCANPQDDDESDGTSQCQDGLDNDGDGLTDMFDPGCSTPTDDNESDGTSQCQDGIDNDGDGSTDYPADIGCSSPQDDDEGDVLAECQDGIDNDGDGNTDYPADTGCFSNQDTSELNGYQCDNGFDDDGDGLIDLNDPGCDNTTDNDESDGTSQCQDGLDNDGDGLTDMNDPGCANPQDDDESDGTSQCQDSVDNDGDGLTDMNDPGCSDPTDDNEFDGTSQCQDGIDNDGDGATDYPADIGCSSPQDDDEGDVLSQCQDGIDNDGDGDIDYPADAGCYSTQDNSELNGNQCDNGFDDDGDGLVDLADPGCDNTTDNNESDGTSQCQDGLDNDGDGLVDMNDPGCATPQDNDESDGTTQCQDGVDNDGDGVIDMNDPGCISPQDNNEFDGTTQCQDGIDNDGDSLVDLADPGCANALDNDESDGTTQCQDGLDNDADGVIDMLDPDCANATDDYEGGTSGPIPGTVSVDPDMSVSRITITNQDSVYAGDITHFNFIFRNSGDTDFDNVRIQVGIPELGIVRRAGPFDIDEGVSMSKSVSLFIPYGTYPGEYLTRITVFDEESKRVHHRPIVVQ